MATEAKSRPLFDIANDLMAIDQLLDETSGEITPETEAAFATWFAEAAENEAVKLDGYCWLIDKLTSEAAIAKSVSEEYAMRAQVRTNKAARMKQRMKDYLESTGRATPGKPKTETTKAVLGKTVQTASGRILAIQRNGGAPSLEIDENVRMDDPAVEPFLMQIIDREAVKRHLKECDELPFARLKPAEGTHLRIR